MDMEQIQTIGDISPDESIKITTDENTAVLADDSDKGKNTAGGETEADGKVNAERGRNTDSLLSRLISNPDAIKSILSVVSLLDSSGSHNISSGTENVRKSKIPDDLFDNLPQGPEDHESVEYDNPGEKNGQDTASSSESGGFDFLLNSDLISKLPELIDAAKPVIAMLGKLGGHNEPGEKKTSYSGKKSVDEKKRTALLLALKPYLNPHRCETVDLLISVGRLTSILHKS